MQWTQCGGLRVPTPPRLTELGIEAALDSRSFRYPSRIRWIGPSRINVGRFGSATLGAELRHPLCVQRPPASSSVDSKHSLSRTVLLAVSHRRCPIMRPRVRRAGAVDQVFIDCFLRKRAMLGAPSEKAARRRPFDGTDALPPTRCSRPPRHLGSPAGPRRVPRPPAGRWRGARRRPSLPSPCVPRGTPCRCPRGSAGRR